MGASVAARGRRYHCPVTSILLATALVLVLLLVAFAFLWQERRPRPEASVTYGIEDAIDFITARLTPATAARVGRNDVRRILAWQMRYVQDPDLRSDDDVVVVGGLEAAEFAQQQALAEGHPYDGDVIIEVLDRQSEYLAALGAIGDPVAPDQVQRVIDRWAEPGQPATQEETPR